MTKLERAAQFAAEYHTGQVRKLGGAPYIIHLYETVGNAAMLTAEEDILVAAFLHDSIEDTAATSDIIRENFGDRVANIVLWCSEDKMRDRLPNETWQERKVRGIERMRKAPREAKIVLLADKLSNIRSIASYYSKLGDAVWGVFNNFDKSAHEWAYRSYIEELSEFKYEFPYKELERLVEEVFGAGFDL